MNFLNPITHFIAHFLNYCLQNHRSHRFNKSKASGYSIAKAIALCLVPLGMLAVAVPVYAEYSPESLYTSDGLRYQIEGDTVSILGCNSDIIINNDTLIIPDTIGGLLVTKIEKQAFKEQKNFKKVILPKELESIGAFAFTKTKLQKFNAPASLKTLGLGAFSHCKALKMVDLSKSQIAMIKAFTFSGCEKLRKVLLSENIKEIDDFAFWMDKKLTVIENLNDTVNVHAYAFTQCESIKHPLIEKMMLEIKR
jgi:hypothetical protein